MSSKNRFVPGPVPFILLPFVLISLLCTALTGEERFESESIADDIRELREEIHAINLINDLCLSPYQIDVTLAQARLARPYFETRASMLREIYRLQVEVFREFKAEDELNQGLSDEIIRRVGHAEHLEREINERVYSRVNKFSEKVYHVLTPSQRRLVDEYEPFLFPQEQRERELRKKSDSRYRALEELLFEINRMSDSQYRLKKSRMVDKVFNQLPRPKRPLSSARGAKRADRKKEMAFEEDRDAIKSRIADLLDRVRGMERKDLEIEVRSIIEEELLVSGKEKLLRNMTRIARSKRESLNSVSQYLLIPGVIPFLEEQRKKSKGRAAAGGR